MQTLKKCECVILTLNTNERERETNKQHLNSNLNALIIIYIHFRIAAIHIQEIIDTKFARLSIVDTRYSLWDYYFHLFICDDSNQFQCTKFH